MPVSVPMVPQDPPARMVGAPTAAVYSISSPPRDPVPLVGGADDGDDDLSSFAQLRENLLGIADAKSPARPTETVRIVNSDRTPASPGALGRSPARSNNVPYSTIVSNSPHAKETLERASVTLGAEFEALRSSISSKLRGTSAQGMRAADLRAFGAPMAPTPSAAEPAPTHKPPARSLAFVGEGSAAATPAHPEPAGSVRPVSNDTVMLSARKPGAAGGPNLITAMDAAQAAAAGDAAGAASAPPIGGGVGGESTLLRADANAAAKEAPTLMFGHLAMEAALESHRRHYEDARSRLPAIAAKRPTPGVAPPPPPPSKPSRIAAAKPPKLATASRARPPKVPNYDSAPAPKEELAEQLRSLAPRRGATPSKAARPASAGRPKRAGGRVPIKKPAASDNVTLMPVTATGAAPSLDTVRATERLVTALASSGVEVDPADVMVGEGEFAHDTGYGEFAPRASVQRHSIDAAVGEARQAALSGSMAAHAANMYRHVAELG